MARGKLEKTKLKEAITEAVRTTTAYSVAGEVLEQSKRKAHEKKPLYESFREHIGKAIDRIDPIELAVILSGTYIIHETIKGTESLLARVSTAVLNFAATHDKDNPFQQPIPWLETLAIDLASFGWVPIINTIIGITTPKTTNVNYDPSGNFIGPVAPGKTATPTTSPLGSLPTQADITLWLVSFVVAYIGIKNAGKIGSSILDITGVLAFLGM